MDNKALLIIAVLLALFLWKRTQQSNEEKWELVRDENTGRLLNVIVHRKVESR